MGLEDASLRFADPLLDQPQVNAYGRQSRRRLVPHRSDEGREFPCCLGHQQQDGTQLLGPLCRYFGTSQLPCKLTQIVLFKLKIQYTRIHFQYILLRLLCLYKTRIKGYYLMISAVSIISNFRVQSYTANKTYTYNHFVSLPIAGEVPGRMHAFSRRGDPSDHGVSSQ